MTSATESNSSAAESFCRSRRPRPRRLTFSSSSSALSGTDSSGSSFGFMISSTHTRSLPMWRRGGGKRYGRNPKGPRVAKKRAALPVDCADPHVPLSGVSGLLEPGGLPRPRGGHDRAGLGRKAGGDAPRGGFRARGPGPWVDRVRDRHAFRLPDCPRLFGGGHPVPGTAGADPPGGHGGLDRVQPDRRSPGGDASGVAGAFPVVCAGPAEGVPRHHDAGGPREGHGRGGGPRGSDLESRGGGVPLPGNGDLLAGRASSDQRDARYSDRP